MNWVSSPMIMPQLFTVHLDSQHLVGYTHRCDWLVLAAEPNRW
jgi:hypothetical protein